LKLTFAGSYVNNVR